MSSNLDILELHNLVGRGNKRIDYEFGLALWDIAIVNNRFTDNNLLVKSIYWMRHKIKPVFFNSISKLNGLPYNSFDQFLQTYLLHNKAETYFSYAKGAIIFIKETKTILIRYEGEWKIFMKSIKNNTPDEMKLDQEEVLALTPVQWHY